MFLSYSSTFMWLNTSCLEKMKEILQTKQFKTEFSSVRVCSVLIFLYCASFHVATIDKDHQPTLDAEEPGAEYQQDQQEQHSEPEPYEGAEQDQAYDYVDYTNSSDLQGKHRFILNQSRTSFES